MKKFLAVVFLFAVIFGIWWLFFKPKSSVVKIKEEPISVQAHSGEFNNSVSTAMNSYFDMKSAFVNADTLKAKEQGIKFLNLVDSIKIDELKKDTAAILSAVSHRWQNMKHQA